MLSSILSKETCSKCRFCCAFKKESLWETPLFEPEFSKEPFNKDHIFLDQGDHCRMDLTESYKTQDPNEEAPCFYLDPDKGCSLGNDKKPFDCKIWPFRLMDQSGQLVLALTPTCPAINKYTIDELKDFADREGFGKAVYDYGQKHPYIIKKYREGFPVIKKYS